MMTLGKQSQVTVLDADAWRASLSHNRLKLSTNGAFVVWL